MNTFMRLITRDHCSKLDPKRPEIITLYQSGSLQDRVLGMVVDTDLNKRLETKSTAALERYNTRLSTGWKAQLRNVLLPMHEQSIKYSTSKYTIQHRKDMQEIFAYADVIVNGSKGITARM